LSSFTLNCAFGSGSTTVPSTSMTSSLLATKKARPGCGPDPA
jgi:hypothetical protein